MKTLDDFVNECKASMRPDDVIFKEFMLEAKRAGMTEAADILCKQQNPFKEDDTNRAFAICRNMVNEAILSARDNLKEI